VFSLFFFQAEDGIRDFHVTGVQTCALPICCVPVNDCSPGMMKDRLWHGFIDQTGAVMGKGFTYVHSFPLLNNFHIRVKRLTAPRSEERRVGKECSSRESG